MASKKDGIQSAKVCSARENKEEEVAKLSNVMICGSYSYKTSS